MKYVVLILILCSNLAFASEIIEMNQLGETQKKVGDEIKLQVLSRDEKLVRDHFNDIQSHFILPYVYVLNINEENGMIFFDAIVTNLNEKYKPIKFGEDIVLFNIQNESIDKTKLELPKDFLFNFREYKLTQKKILYFLGGTIFFLLLIIVFFLKIYPILKLKKAWNQRQEKIISQISRTKTKEDIEHVYKIRKDVDALFIYNKTQFEALISLIDRNQYMESWKNEDLEKAKSLLSNLTFNKKKYGGN